MFKTDNGLYLYVIFILTTEKSSVNGKLNCCYDILKNNAHTFAFD